MNGSDSLKEMAITLGSVITFLHGFIDFALMMFGYALRLILPIIVWVTTYKQLKSDAQQKTSTNEDVLIHFKASMYAFFAMVLSTLIFVFIFQKLIGLSENTQTIITTILHINKAFH